MTSFLLRYGVVWLCIVLVCVGCTTVTTEGLAQNKSDSARMPPNYRSMIARYILTHENLDKATLNTAKISTPFVRGGGLFGGDPVAAACVSVYTSNMLGMHFTGYSVYLVKNVQVEREPPSTAIISSTCGPFSPFHEVMKR